MLNAETLSVGIAFLALIFTSLLLARQARQMEHERNASAILESIERITDERVLLIFERLSDINERYPTDDDIRQNYRHSQDERDFIAVASFVETVACLARRRVIDPSLVVDAVGLILRKRWEEVREFTMRRRRLEQNEYIFENFEWLAMYSAWWKETPRPRFDRNYNPNQFAGVTFRV
jgi:hypothetical protein